MVFYAGYARPGVLTALMGGSGAGVLLHCTNSYYSQVCVCVIVLLILKTTQLPLPFVMDAHERSCFKIKITDAALFLSPSLGPIRHGTLTSVFKTN